MAFGDRPASNWGDPMGTGMRGNATPDSEQAHDRRIQEDKQDDHYSQIPSAHVSL